MNFTNHVDIIQLESVLGIEQPVLGFSVLIIWSLGPEKSRKQLHRKAHRTTDEHKTGQKSADPAAIKMLFRKCNNEC